MTGQPTEQAYNCLRAGLEAIRGPGNAEPFTDAYRDAGGGYEGLQAIAQAALDAADAFDAAQYQGHQRCVV